MGFEHGQDLNANPSLPLDNETVDAALCAVSVQYLQRSEHVFKEVARALRLDDPVIVSF
jgi:ubiquinone/menaquinone biosynthesis C-methylase UbiE